MFTRTALYMKKSLKARGEGAKLGQKVLPV
jgi:hypothetical protein